MSLKDNSLVLVPTYFVNLPDDVAVVSPPGEGVLAGVAGAGGGGLHLLRVAGGQASLLPSCNGVVHAVQATVGLPPVRDGPLEAGQPRPLTPALSRQVVSHPAGEGGAAAAVLLDPLYEAAVQTVGHRVHVALAQVVVERLEVFLRVAEFLVFKERESSRGGLGAKYGQRGQGLCAGLDIKPWI